jgi:hypothetical protein
MPNPNKIVGIDSPTKAPPTSSNIISGTKVPTFLPGCLTSCLQRWLLSASLPRGSKRGNLLSQSPCQDRVRGLWRNAGLWCWWESSSVKTAGLWLACRAFMTVSVCTRWPNVVVSGYIGIHMCWFSCFFLWLEMLISIVFFLGTAAGLKPATRRWPLTVALQERSFFLSWLWQVTEQNCQAAYPALLAKELKAAYQLEASALLSLCMISSFGAKNVVGGWPPWFWWLELHPAFLSLFGSLSCEMLDFSHWPDLSFSCGRGIIPASGTGWSWRGAKRLSPRPLDQLVASHYDLEGNSGNRTSQKRILFLKGSTRALTKNPKWIPTSTVTQSDGTSSEVRVAEQNLNKYIVKHEVLDPDPIFVYIHQLIEIDKINWIA